MQPTRHGGPPGKPSRTAMMVALWRALADLGVTTVPRFSDPQAREMLSGWPWKAMLRRAERRAASGRAQPPDVVRAVDGITLRVAFIDSVLAEVRHPQVVILGAGLDTRAWRLDALRGARVFEVDHPATQAYKRARVASLAAPLGEHAFVPVDFRVDDLDAALEGAGHRRTEPTAWVWEGVIMYLDDEALRRTLAVVTRRSAPKSTLVAHYHEPERTAAAGWLRRLLFGWLGEPQIGQRSRDQVRREVEAAGLDIVEDADIRRMAERSGGGNADHPRAQLSRILVAAKGEVP